MTEARKAVEEALGGRLEDHFAEFGPPVAAASIAQVHKAVVIDNGVRRDVAVKILRPGIERRFRRDLDSYFFAARQIERFHPPSRRLRPVAVVDTLARSVEIEMDMRLEAAAISEMADNIAGDSAPELAASACPTVDWRRTAQRVLTLEWIDGIPISDHAALRAAGLDLRALGLTILQLVPAPRHARRLLPRRHAPGQSVRRQGRAASSPSTSASWAGSAPRSAASSPRSCTASSPATTTAPPPSTSRPATCRRTTPVEVFAQAMRAIGEPIHGRTAEEISMADLLGQLFAYTEVFDMQTRPELLLLQKTMVVVEGVARSLDPALNIWTAAEPIAKEWIEANTGVAGRLREAGEGAELLRQGDGRGAAPAGAGRAHGPGAGRHGARRPAARRRHAWSASPPPRPTPTAGPAGRCGSARWRWRRWPRG